ncbi:hypothetical protein [Streptomyces sp. NPDC093097]|uniref:hypothetical protein n=1 Tax=Streptomyces sp. NPDC093097 TaxID=3366027 RepID=UPI0038131B2D
MEDAEEYAEEVEYLVDYARMTLLNFHPVWDSAEGLAGDGASVEVVMDVTLRLISDMLDHGVILGDMSSRPDEGFMPWDTAKDESLRRVSERMRRHPNRSDFLKVCWFSFS